MPKTNQSPSPRVEALIDENLKLIYSDLVQDDLPDRFKDLLDLLKAQDVEAKTAK